MLIAWRLLVSHAMPAVMCGWTPVLINTIVWLGKESQWNVCSGDSTFLQPEQDWENIASKPTSKVTYLRKNFNWHGSFFWEQYLRSAPLLWLQFNHVACLVASSHVHPNLLFCIISHMKVTPSLLSRYSLWYFFVRISFTLASCCNSAHEKSTPGHPIVDLPTLGKIHEVVK